MIRGTFDTTSPTILKGSGFTLTKSSTGRVTVNFSAAFSAAPTVVATGSFDITHVSAPTTTSCLLAALTSAGAATEDTLVSFIAIGPR